MKLHKLTPEGIQEFCEFLDSLSTDGPKDVPADLLEDPKRTVNLGIELPELPGSFSSRLELAVWLDAFIPEAKRAVYLHDRGLWAWLGLLLFKVVCPKPKGKWKPGATARWIPETGNHQRYYRHLLAGPYSIYHAHREEPKRAMALLCGRVDKPGDLVEQLASRQGLVTNAGVVEAATQLYFDADKGSLKRGAGGKGKGSPRRLAFVLDQLDLTFDLYGLGSGELLSLLPKEFERFA